MSKVDDSKKEKRRVAIMRPAEYIENTKKLFQDHGYEVISAPFLKIVPLMNPLECASNFEYDYLILSSQTSAKLVREKAPELLKKGKVISIGKITAREIKRNNTEILIPSKFDSKTLFQEFYSLLKGKRVIIFRSDKGDPILLKLSEIAQVKECIIYSIEFDHGDKQKRFLKTIIDEGIDFIVFSSRMMVHSFFELSKKMNIKEKIKERLNGVKVVVVAIGPPTRSELIKHGIQPLMPDEYTFEGVLRLIQEFKSSNDI